MGPATSWLTSGCLSVPPITSVLLPAASSTGRVKTEQGQLLPPLCGSLGGILHALPHSLTPPWPTCVAQELEGGKGQSVEASGLPQGAKQSAVGFEPLRAAAGYCLGMVREGRSAAWSQLPPLAQVEKLRPERGSWTSEPPLAGAGAVLEQQCPFPEQLQGGNLKERQTSPEGQLESEKFL